jgi:hypothetical protein
MVNSWKRGTKSLLSRHVESVLFLDLDREVGFICTSPFGGGGGGMFTVNHVHADIRFFNVLHCKAYIKVPLALICLTFSVTLSINCLTSFHMFCTPSPPVALVQPDLWVQLITKEELLT